MKIYLKKLTCFIFGHDYFLIQRMTEWSRRIGCRRCEKTFGMNDNVRCVIPWDDELAALYVNFYKVELKEWPEKSPSKTGVMVGDKFPGDGGWGEKQ